MRTRLSGGVAGEDGWKPVPPMPIRRCRRRRRVRPADFKNGWMAKSLKSSGKSSGDVTRSTSSSYGLAGDDGRHKLPQRAVGGCLLRVALDGELHQTVA